MFCGSFESVSKCCLDRFVALNLWEIYIFNLGHWDFAFKLFLSTPQEILEVSGAIEFYCEKKLTLCLSCYWCSTGQRYIYTGSHDCCVYIFDLVISFPVLHFCSTFHCIIILTVYFNARLFYWGLCSIYIWLKVFRLFSYHRKWQLFTALLPQKHSRTGEFWIRSVLFPEGPLILIWGRYLGKLNLKLYAVTSLVLKCIDTSDRALNWIPNHPIHRGPSTC